MSAKKPTGLGKGIDALISSNFDRSILTDENERVQNLFISDIFPNDEQPRKHFDEKGLNELASSIKQYGVLQPLIVVAKNKGYEIIAGERRWRAAQIANLKKVPTIVRKPKKQERLEIALIENVQRVDLSPLETAVAIEKLHQEFSLGYEEIASRLSKAPATVSNIVRLLQLPQTAMEALQSNEITEGHARAILSLKGNESQQKELLDLILKNSWSVRQAEQYAVSAKQGAKSRPQIAKRMSTTLPGTKKLSQKLTTPVTIKRTARGGRIEIHFKDDSQLEDILKNLNK